MKKRVLILIGVIITSIAFGAVLAQAAPSSSALENANSHAVSKLTDTKLRVCQNRQAAITKRSTQLVKMASNMMNVFTKIATRVETYYTGTVVSAGKSVSNYDALVTDITTKESAVKTDLEKATTDAAVFDCASDNPKAQLTTFRTDMQKVKQDLKAYRTSIKNLIVAVRTVNAKSTTSETSSDNTSSNNETSNQ